MTRLLIINSVIWAILLLVCSYLFKDHPDYKYLFGMLIIGAGLLNALIYTESKKQKKK